MRVLCQAVGANVRYRLDGEPPTATQGQVLVANGDMLELADNDDMDQVRFFEATNTATVECHFQLTRV